MTADTPTRSSTVLISSRQTLFHIHWEICELAEALTNLFLKEDTAPDTTALSKAGPPKQSKKLAHHQDVQVVFATDKSEIILDLSLIHI